MTSGSSRIIYVDQAASGANDGTSWANAYVSLQSALAAAHAGDQIWVAEGIYYPTTGTDQRASFRMVEGVEIYGGFASGAQSLGEQDWVNRATILSGNIGDPATTSDNTWQIVIGANNAVLDGFVVQDGHAPEPPSGPAGVPAKPILGQHMTPFIVLEGGPFGAGIYNYQAAPVVRNCIVERCSAGKGGGIYNMTATAPGVTAPSPVFINVTVRDCRALQRGGGMMNDLGTNPLLVNCTFERNTCLAKCGGLYNDFACSPLVVNSTFTGNTADSVGGMGNDGTSNPILVGCTVTGNTAKYLSGGINFGSYNANFPHWANVPTILDTRIKGNVSLTHAPADWFIWGEDWIVAYETDIEGWEYSSENEPHKGLIALAREIADLDAKTIWERYGAELLAFTPTGDPMELDPNRPGFGVDFQLVTEVEIPSAIFYVDAVSGATSPDGASWASAFSDLQQAIDAASSAGGGQVWVAEGSYYPGTTRDSSFVMKPFVALYGGFARGAQTLSERDWVKHATVLSGNIGDPSKATENVYHVVKGAFNGILDGFVVQDGYADGIIKDRFGGGMFNWGHDASAIVRNTTFINNYAADGGAVFNFLDCLAYFKNVTFAGNRALMGGAMSNRFGAGVRLDDCLVKDNFAEYRAGGIMVNYGSNVECHNVVFEGNVTNGCGGGVMIDDQASQYGWTTPLFRGCSFSGNKSAYEGGALSNYQGASTWVDECSFSGNVALQGNDLANTQRANLWVSACPSASAVYDDGSAFLEHGQRPSPFPPTRQHIQP